MNYVHNNEKPMADVDVYVVTKSGVKGIAKYWPLTGKWLTQDERIRTNDKVVKWKYAQAT